MLNADVYGLDLVNSFLKKITNAKTLFLLVSCHSLCSLLETSQGFVRPKLRLKIFCAHFRIAQGLVDLFPWIINSICHHAFILAGDRRNCWRWKKILFDQSGEMLEYKEGGEMRKQIFMGTFEHGPKHAHRMWAVFEQSTQDSFRSKLESECMMFYVSWVWT